MIKVKNTDQMKFLCQIVTDCLYYISCHPFDLSNFFVGSFPSHNFFKHATPLGKRKVDVGREKKKRRRKNTKKGDLDGLGDSTDNFLLSPFNLSSSLQYESLLVGEIVTKDPKELSEISLIQGVMDFEGLVDPGGVGGGLLLCDEVCGLVDYIRDSNWSVWEGEMVFVTLDAVPLPFRFFFFSFVFFSFFSFYFIFLRL